MPGVSAPRLIIGIGNPSRGDDAVGPLAIEWLAEQALHGVDLLTDFQLQVEHALDLRDRSEVIFIDASLTGPAPFEFFRVDAAADQSISSHALSPAALLHAYRQLFGAPPTANILAIRGYQFDLGKALQPMASTNLEAAMAWLTAHLQGEPTTA